jgi:hypothetical protein
MHPQRLPWHAFKNVSTFPTNLQIRHHFRVFRCVLAYYNNSVPRRGLHGLLSRFPETHAFHGR